MNKRFENIIELLKDKASVKQDVFLHGKTIFKEFKETASEIINDLSSRYSAVDPRVKLIFEDINEQEFRIVVGGDILLFHMHTNVFLFDKSHYYWQQSYFKEDQTRAYGAIIQVYNFLTDSLKLERDNDLGFLIGRIFLNRDNHFMVESKQKLNTRYPYLSKQEFTKEYQRELIYCLLIYSMEFELNIPPYSQVQTVSVRQALEFKNSNKVVTSKRLGFRFGGQKSKDFD
jgi:hypothetical protein